MPPWTRIVIGVAACRLVVALGATYVGMPPEQRAAPSEVYLGLIVVFGIAGTALLTLGRHDRRAVSLAVCFLLVGASFTGPFWKVLVQAFPDTDGAVNVALSVQAEAFLPYFFWLFARDFPRVNRVAAQALRRTLAGVLAICSAFFAANLALGFGPTGPMAAWIDRWMARGAPSRLYWAASFLLIVGALTYAQLRARRANADERRRMRILIAGIAVGIAPILVVVLLGAVVPTVHTFIESPGGAHTAGLVVYPALYSIPIVTAYAVLVHRALDLRLIVRRALQYATARYAFMLLAAAPFAWVLAAAYANRNQSLAQLWSGESGLALAGAAAGGVFLMLARPRRA